MRPKHEVTDILKRNRYRLSSYYSNSWQLRTLHALRKCRTADLGGHIDQCDSCGNRSISYNSCRNRHCPGSPARSARVSSARHGYRHENVRLLLVPCFHVVFTLPEQINPLYLYAPAKVYCLLFSTAWSVKDYRKGTQKLQMSLSDKEFICTGNQETFQSTYLAQGLCQDQALRLSSSWKPAKLPCLQQMFGLLPSSDDQEETVSHRRCCACGTGTLQTMSMFYGRVRPGGRLQKSGRNGSESSRTVSSQRQFLSVTG